MIYCANHMSLLGGAPSTREVKPHFKLITQEHPPHSEGGRAELPPTAASIPVVSGPADSASTPPSTQRLASNTVLSRLCPAKQARPAAAAAAASMRQSSPSIHLWYIRQLLNDEVQGPQRIAHPAQDEHLAATRLVTPPLCHNTASPGQNIIKHPAHLNSLLLSVNALHPCLPACLSRKPCSWAVHLPALSKELT
jgi:hypothetical protein